MIHLQNQTESEFRRADLLFNAGHLSLQRLVNLTSAGPARIFDIVGKSRSALVYDTGLKLIDLATRRTIRGHLVVCDEQLAGTPLSQAIHFLDAHQT